MKKILSLLISILILKVGFAQSLIEANQIEPTYSADVAKANKKGLVTKLGFFGEISGNQFYLFSAYKPKKAEEYTMVVNSFDINGNQTSQRTFPMNETEAELAKLNLTSIKLNDKTTKAELSDIREKYESQKMAKIKSPTLAGKPTIEVGEYTPVFKSMDDGEMFERYSYTVLEEIKIDERFWCSVAMPIDNFGLGISSDSYLVNKKTYEISTLETMANIMANSKRLAPVPVDKIAYIGGAKATNEMTTFISGTIDLKTAEWKTKYEIETIDKIGGRKHTSVTLPNGNLAIQLPFTAQKDELPGVIMLTVDKTGKEIDQKKVTFNTGISKRMFANNLLLAKTEEGYLNISTLTTLSNTQPHFAISKMVSGKETLNKVYNLENLAETAILPPNAKFKANKITFYESFWMFEMDDKILIPGQISMSSGEKYQTIIDLNEDGDINAMYIYPLPTYPDMDIKELPVTIVGTKNINELAVQGYTSPQFRKVNSNEYYVLTGMTVPGIEKGINSTGSVTNTDFFGTKTIEVNYFRIDYDRTFVGVNKINFANKTISNSVIPAALINGDQPGYVLKNGSLYLESDSKLVLIK